MVDVAKLKAADILNVPEDNPERLFSYGYDDAKRDYHALVLVWHPDRHPGDKRAEEVFKHVVKLYNFAIKKLDRNEWDDGHLYVVVGMDGRTRKIPYVRKAPFDFGTTYICKSKILFFFDKAFLALFENARGQMTGFRYGSDKMQEEFSRYLPQLHSTFETEKHQVVVIERDPNYVRLRDLVDHLGGIVPPEHVAWIMSRLHNLECYLNWIGRTHNEISMDSVFVFPAMHNLALLGGWWFSTALGGRLLGASKRAMAVMPPSILNKKASETRFDLNLVRLLGRELLGDAVGHNLTASGAPRPMIEWLRGAPGNDALHEYRNWRKTVLPASFGAPCFVKLEVSASEIYAKGE